MDIQSGGKWLKEEERKKERKVRSSDVAGAAWWGFISDLGSISSPALPLIH